MDVAQVISIVLGSSTLATMVTVFLNRGSIKAQTENIVTNTAKTIGDTYGKLLEEQKKFYYDRIQMLEDRIKSYRSQVDLLTEKEIKLLDNMSSIIAHNETLRSKIEAMSKIERERDELKLRIATLEREVDVLKNDSSTKKKKQRMEKV